MREGMITTIPVEDLTFNLAPRFRGDQWGRRMLASKVTHDMLALPLEHYGETQYRECRPTKKNLYHAWKNTEAVDDPRSSSMLEEATTSTVVQRDYRSRLSVYRDGFSPTRVGISQGDLLPEEIKDSICADHGFSEDDWYNLSFIRPFHHAAMKLLYKNINCHRDSLVSLTRTLLEHEDLAGLVECLDIEDGCAPWCLEDEDYHILFAHVKANGLTNADEEHFVDIMRKYCDGKEAILTTMLVLSVRKIRQLSISSNIFRPSQQQAFPDHIWTSPFSSRHSNGFSFNLLSRVHISGTGASVSELAPFFKLPLLTTLIACGFEEVEEHAKRTWNPTGFSQARDSNIEVLELYGGEIHTYALKAMLSTCRSLKAFAFDFCQFEYNDRKESGNPQDLANFAAIREALKPFSNTLRSLSLDETRVTYKARQWQPLGSLKEFTKLEYVRLDIDALYGADSAHWQPMSSILPCSIKGIDIFNPVGSYWVDHALLRFEIENVIEDMVVDSTVLPNLNFFATTHMERSTEYQLKARGVDARRYKTGSDVNYGEPWGGATWETRPRMSRLMGLT